jgi:hypothetical protein
MISWKMGRGAGGWGAHIDLLVKLCLRVWAEDKVLFFAHILESSILSKVGSVHKT